MQDEVDLTAEDGTLIICPVRNTRAGWAEAFQEMARHGDDTLLHDVPPTLSDWDEEEWEW